MEKIRYLFFFRFFIFLCIVMDAKDAAKKVTETVVHAEETLDEVVGNVADKVDKVIPDTAKVTAAQVAHTAEEVADKVDQVAGRVDGFVDSVLPEQTGTDIDFVPQRQEKVSRLFILRFLRWIIQYFVYIVWGIVFSVIFIVHVVYMLILGKRNRRMWNAQVRFIRHFTKWSLYTSGIIDRRPDLIER